MLQWVPCKVAHANARFKVQHKQTSSKVIFYSPHLCVGFLFLVAHSRPYRLVLLLPPPSAHSLPTLTHTQHHTTLSHDLHIHTHTTYSHTTCSHTTCSHTTYSHTTYSHGTRLALVARLGPVVATAVCVAGVALMAHWAGSGGALGSRGHRGCLYGRRGTWWHWLHFAWQAWHLATSTFTLRGRRGTYGNGSWAGSHGALGSVVAAAVCVAGVALGDIGLHCAWQAWHLATLTFTLRGRCGIWRHRPSLCVAGVALVLLGCLWWRAWVPWSPRLFAWQAWHLATLNFSLRGRRGTYGTGLALVARLGPVVAAAVCVAGAAPILHHLFSVSCLSHPILTFFLATYWKKLTCGVIRSFNLLTKVPAWYIEARGLQPTSQSFIVSCLSAGSFFPGRGYEPFGIIQWCCHSVDCPQGYRVVYWCQSPFSRSYFPGNRMVFPCLKLYLF